MIVKRLKVKDYRNARDRTVELCPGCNAFVGANARGKTNLLEAVYFAGVGKSFRTPRDKELIHRDCSRAFIIVEAERETGTETVKIILDREANKRVAINDVPISRMSELMGVCPVVLFCPDGLKIVKEAPADRRRFMDIALCQVSKAYFNLLSRYDKILQSRNKLIKSGGATRATVAPWDELLADAGAGIIKSRRGYIAKLSSHAEKFHAYLSSGAEKLELDYEGADGDGVDAVKSNLLEKYELDFSDFRSYGPQGQQRTVALSLKLAETELLTEVLGTSPVLLLDDVFSELDRDRREKLLSTLVGFQTIITATDDDELARRGVNVIRI